MKFALAAALFAGLSLAAPAALERVSHGDLSVRQNFGPCAGTDPESPPDCGGSGPYGSLIGSITNGCWVWSCSPGLGRREIL